MTAQTQDRTSERAVRIPEVLYRVGISRTQLYRLIARGDFPPPIRLSDRISIWRQHDVDAWLQERLGCNRVSE
jgi:prophage regulatory protein